MIAREQVETALQELPGLENVTVSRRDSKGLAYYPADHAATRWYASSHLHKSLNVQTFDWLITFTGLVGEQPLLQVGHASVQDARHLHVRLLHTSVFFVRKSDILTPLPFPLLRTRCILNLRSELTHKKMLTYCGILSHT